MPDTFGHAIYLRFDTGFFPYARACLNSLCVNDPDHPQILVDYRGEDESVLRYLHIIGAMVLPPDEPPGFAQALRPVQAGWAAFDRFRLWRRAFDPFDTILHLDADMLVLAPLGDLFDKPDPYFVANHERSPGTRIFRSGETPLARLSQDRPAGLDGIDDMVNAGLFTLPRQHRTRADLARLAQLARRHGPSLAYADQSLLSLWLHDKGIAPSLTFADNFQVPLLTDPGTTLPFSKIRVLHFSGSAKPGTRAFDSWERVAGWHARLHTLFQRYRDMDPRSWA